MGGRPSPGGGEDPGHSCSLFHAEAQVDGEGAVPRCSAGYPVPEPARLGSLWPGVFSHRLGALSRLRHRAAVGFCLTSPHVLRGWGLRSSERWVGAGVPQGPGVGPP